MYGKEFDIFPTTFFIFAFDSIELNILVDKINEINSEHNTKIEKRIDSICILSKGIITNQTNNTLFAVPKPNTTLKAYKTDKSLLTFHVLLMMYLTQAWLPKFNFNKYIDSLQI